jgi:prepilin-type N-terminal cleavage/methylation domain-containing protein
MKRNQSGFTLIEIAIVLVIIGLLLGGVLKGQELINSAKVKNLATDFKNVPVYIYGYQDKFRALPGDDIDAVAHLGASAVAAASGVGATGGNGTINGTWNAGAGDSESNKFWQHVRMANLAAGPTDDPTKTDLRPNNAMGAKIGITNAGDSPITGLTGSFILCSDGIPGKFAAQLDLTMDDGKPDGGSMREITSPTGAASATSAATSLTADTGYLVCMGF